MDWKYSKNPKKYIHIIDCNIYIYIYTRSNPIREGGDSNRDKDFDGEIGWMRMRSCVVLEYLFSAYVLVVAFLKSVNQISEEEKYLKPQVQLKMLRYK